ncbi:hypothetical protein [Bacillus alkalicellulosilyticus]|uniref:hypothetical protein n=1 Tax=Alkalihalobacterium alkalicellulosilyticum TaxID=1912214 RepID=UPI0009977CB7|nr:hypothetical protein [Bacillus alkalicellulosilyticus]
MNVNIEGVTNVAEAITSLLAYGIIFLLFYRLYMKQESKPVIWKAIVVALVGFFTFSIHWEESFRIPILPLGVWIVLWYAKARKGAWKRYRKFAWLGFFSNFIFLVLSLLTILLQDAFYPKQHPATYLASFEEVEIISIHPSAMEGVQIDEARLEEAIDNLVVKPINGIQWYNDMTLHYDTMEVAEKFPYMLTGVSAKWGSGIDVTIYVEHDGQGLLITTKQTQLYMRSNQSLFKEAETE